MQCLNHSVNVKLLIGFCFLCMIFMLTVAEDRKCGLKPVFRSSGDLRLAIVVNECNSVSLSETIVRISAWVCDRFNVLNLFGDLRIGADIYRACEEKDMIDLVVNNVKHEFGLGIVSWKLVPPKIWALANVLDTQITVIPKQWRPLVTATVEFLSALHWKDNLTIVTEDPEVLTLFYHESRKHWMCVKNVKSFKDKTITNFLNPTVLFGNGEDITQLLQNISQSIFNKLIIVPLDGTHFDGVPDGSFILQPIYTDTQQNITKSPKIIPSPLLLDISVPLINLATNISNSLNSFCNHTGQEFSCLKKSGKVILNNEILPKEILKYLKIESLLDKFVYNIFKVENLEFNLKLDGSDYNSTNSSETAPLQSYVKIGTYNVFNLALILDNMYLENDNATINQTTCSQNHKMCIYECLNFKSDYLDINDDDYLKYNLVLKQEPWILAVLSVSSLGILFCVAILIFIFVRLCKRDIFEGNPVLSVLLLLTLTVMYASVVPFGLEVTFETEFRSTLSDYLCLARSLAVTLTYSCVFSLMLSRSIMLATVAYEAGFMSHVTGHVQSLLCLFMIAVQGALSLQSVENCQNLLVSNSFLYALSYDFLLLGLLLCSCPFIYRSQRNYKEGFYFTIAIFLVLLCWIIWITAYILVDDKWKMVTVCSGLLGTASAVLGAIFIPRTYLMTSAVVRDSLTSALPSLAFASSTSVLDLNYANNAQHVYDCVNIATINANMTQALPPPIPQCNLNFYSDEPNLEVTEINGNNPPPNDSPDKVTRF